MDPESIKTLFGYFIIRFKIEQSWPSLWKLIEFGHLKGREENELDNIDFSIRYSHENHG